MVIVFEQVRGVTWVTALTLFQKGTPMRIIGIDPGLALAGYGIIEGDAQNMKPLQYGSLSTPSSMPLSERLSRLYDGMIELLDEYRPEEIAVEELFFNRNVTTAFTVGQARGIFLLAAEQKGLRYHQYTPAQVKLAVTGYGKADKPQIQQMVKVLLNLPAIPKPDDTADALAIAICHMQTSGWRSVVERSRG